MQIDLKNCTVLFKDGGSNSIEIKVGEGTLTYNEQQTREYKLDRGTLDTVRNGDDTPVEVSIDLVWEWLRAHGTSEPTPEEAVKKVGAAAAWATSDTTDACAPYSIDIEVTHNPDCGSELNEVILLSYFRWETLPHDLKAGTLVCTGKCNITQATVTRVAA